ncbi:MAG: hypothetical protein ACXQTC_03710, partial [Methanopyraceae archaeon]
MRNEKQSHRTWAGALAALLLLSGLAGADECVNPGGTGGCWSSIQAAINAASPGDTITVEAGFYNERLQITKSLTFVGAQEGVDPTPAGARTTSSAESIVDIAGLSLVNPNVAIEIPSGVTDVTMDGFTLVGSPISHWADECNVRAWNGDVGFANNIFDGYMGILYKGPGSLTATTNHFAVNKAAIICQPSGINALEVTGNVFALGSNPSTDTQALYMTGLQTGNVSYNVADGFTGRCVGGSNHQ